jgi:hypothetical protein
VKNKNSEKFEYSNFLPLFIGRDYLIYFWPSNAFTLNIP